MNATVLINYQSQGMILYTLYMIVNCAVLFTCSKTLSPHASIFALPYTIFLLVTSQLQEISQDTFI